ncbi:hypothetical protein L1887_58273 [Cichorium endivia]|nr:hypothetical protein L1887_58273 [Cichorium endivia]
MSARKKWCIVLAVAAVIAICVVAVVVPITQVLLKDKSSDRQANTNGSSSNSGSGAGTGANPAPAPEKVVATWGVNGSVIDLGNGNNFTYINNFGGRWASQPLNNSAQAQNYTPPLDQEFDFARNRILGVNLGGWLVTEPFIVPALYEPYENTSNPAVDEFTLSQRYLSEGGADNLRAKMTEHYETFITEQDFANIAAAGLNWVRLPIGFWALETYSNEPFLEGVAWNYVLKAIQWARKYGLRINLDLHAVPGSQNAYNHSGRVGFINYLQGLMGKANGQRTLDYIRQIAQFISQPEIRNVVPMFSVINEPYAISIGQPALQSWYSEVYTILRGIAGTGAGNGPYMTIHDGFLPLSSWSGFLGGGDRVAWDTHPYLCFGQQNNDPLGCADPQAVPAVHGSARQCSLQHGRLHGRRDVSGHQRLRPLPQWRPRRTSLRRLLYRAHAWQLPVRRIVPAVRRLGELLGRDEAGPAPICAHVDGLAARLLLLDLEDRQQPEDGQADIADVVVFARTAAGVDADEPSGRVERRVCGAGIKTGNWCAECDVGQRLPELADGSRVVLLPQHGGVSLAATVARIGKQASLAAPELHTDHVDHAGAETDLLSYCDHYR